MKYFVVSILICVTLVGGCRANILATDVMADIYNTCLSKFSVTCVKPKSLAWLSEAVKSDDIRVTENLSIVRNGNPSVNVQQQPRHGNAQIAILEEVENFLATHSVRVNAPSFITDGSVRSFLPDTIETNDLSQTIEMPLSDGQGEGRGFVKKVMIPFLLGLKFKTTVLVPLAFALIALKTWKALTLGLLSMVLSAAMLIFKFAKPKVINYEVVHYPPHHVEHHIDHHLDHHLDHVHPPHIEHPPPGWEPHGWARQADAQNLAFAGQF
ncbi:hypothetical protein HA402_002356 [Bradysia odoriphaga]|nr:hypothetical protein HA402_002356 [Bradysia odoriphaga]